jgi:hypothetical protein
VTQPVQLGKVGGMANATQLLAVYLHLARGSDLRRQPLVSEKLLALAAATAWEAQLPEIAQQCHMAVLDRNKQHLLRKWENFADAYPSESFQAYLKQLRRRYSPEKAEHLLETLGIDPARESELYADHLEYATALVEAVQRR